MDILSRPEKNYSGLVLNKYLQDHTGAKDLGNDYPNIGHYYAEFGWNYGVDYLWAFAQMLHETNYLRFGGDVTPDQFNFAGLGTTGGGVKGDFYKSALDGVKAQILHLATYAGHDYRKDFVKQANGEISRTEYVYEWILGTAATFESLTQKWATDGSYFNKIKGIYDKMLDALSKYEFHELVVGMGPGYQMMHVAYLNGTMLSRGLTNDCGVLRKEIESPRFVRAPYRNEVEFRTEAYPVLAKVPEEITQNTSTGSQVLKGKTIVLDPGHSESAPGANGLAPDYPEEEDLNRLQASHIASILKRAGANVSVYDPLNDNLWDVGQRARGADMFISLHHNAYDKDKVDEYTCVMVHRTRKRQADIDFAKLCSKKISQAIDNPNFRGQVPQYPEGVYAAGLGVLTSAINTGCPVCVLTESYFIDAYGTWKVAEDRSRKAAAAIAESVIEWFSK